MSNTTNFYKCLLRILLNQSVTVSVFLHWFNFIGLRMFLFPVSKIALLSRPNSFFVGFMSLKVIVTIFFYDHSELWSCCSRHLFPMGLSTSLLFKMRFPSVLICFFMMLAFLCFVAMTLFIIWSYPLLLIYKGFLFYGWTWLSYLTI